MRSGYINSAIGVEPLCLERLRSGRVRAGASCLSDWRDGRGVVGRAGLIQLCARRLGEAQALAVLLLRMAFRRAGVEEGGLLVLLSHDTLAHRQTTRTPGTTRAPWIDMTVGAGVLTSYLFCSAGRGLKRVLCGGWG